MKSIFLRPRLDNELNDDRALAAAIEFVSPDGVIYFDRPLEITTLVISPGIILRWAGNSGVNLVEASDASQES